MGWGAAEVASWRYRSLTISAALVGVAVAVLVAGFVGARVLKASSEPLDAERSHWHLHQPIPVTFGVLSIDSTSVITPEIAGALAKYHGESHHIGSHRPRLLVAATVTNLSAAPVELAARHFHLRGDDGVRVSSLRATGPLGQLAPRSAAKVAFFFPMPAAGSNALLEFRHPRLERVVAVDIGKPHGGPSHHVHDHPLST